MIDFNLENLKKVTHIGFDTKNRTLEMTSNLPIGEQGIINMAQAYPGEHKTGRIADKAVFDSRFPSNIDVIVGLMEIVTGQAFTPALEQDGETLYVRTDYGLAAEQVQTARRAN